MANTRAQLLPHHCPVPAPRVIKFILLKVKINFASCRDLLRGVAILIHCFQRLRGGASTFFIFFAVFHGTSITHFVASVQFCCAAPPSLASPIGTIFTGLSSIHKRTNVDTLHELEPGPYNECGKTTSKCDTRDPLARFVSSTFARAAAPLIVFLSLRADFTLLSADWDGAEWREERCYFNYFSALGDLRESAVVATAAERKSEGRSLHCVSSTMTSDRFCCGPCTRAVWRYVYTSGCCRTALVVC